MTVEPKEEPRKKKHDDISLKEFIKDTSSYVIAEMIFSVIWRTVMFIPRLLIRIYSNWN